ncbi:hypothetical protein NMG46_27745 [Mesorhizobium sp. LMG 17147]|uniref:hypothetical protein n=1 Tax=Mesorhizobium sp. LMG 17147 TaxID=2963091 RepID=UPI0020C944E6|nr:hypothetical protein [Mesorhizobium sp. LMG 17147]MCP9233959.1 hypothetical protein [Mesorhizobium sp. LMG 17147]
MAVDAPVGKDIDQIEAVIDERRFVRLLRLVRVILPTLRYRAPTVSWSSNILLFSGWPE